MGISQSSYRIFLNVIVFIFITSLVSACGGGGGSDVVSDVVSDDGSTDSGANPPSIYPTSLNFSAAPSGVLPASDSILVSHVPGDTLEVSPLSGSMPSWLYVNPVPSSGIPFTIGIEARTTNLAVGVYTETLRFYAVKTVPFREVLGFTDVTVIYTVSNDLYLSQSSMDFHLVEAANTTSKQQSINIDGGNLAWSATANNSWLQASSTSGTGPATIDISLTTAASSLTSGTHNGSVTVRETQSGKEVTLSVTLYIEQHRLFAPDKSVSLLSLPSRSKLSYSIPVEDNAGEIVSWSATDDTSWLSFTSSMGNTAGTLELVADPTGLTNGLHMANVTITSTSHPAISNTEIVRVGLYVNASDALASDNIAYNYVPVGTLSSLKTDPSRPYVYVTNGSDTIDIYNIYSKALVNTITISGAVIHDLVINSDATRMYVANFSDRSIVEVNLDTQTIVKIFSGSYFDSCTTCSSTLSPLQLTYDEPNGFPVLITNSLEVVSVSDGSILKTLAGPHTSDPYRVAANPADKSLFISSMGYSSPKFERHELDYSYLPGIGVYSSKTHADSLSGHINSIRFSPDGSKMCVASNGIACYSSADLSAGLVVSSFTSITGIDIGPTGKYLGGLYYSSGPDVTHYFSVGGVDSSFDAPGYVDEDKVAISGDGMRAVVRSTDTTLTRTTISLVDITP